MNLLTLIYIIQLTVVGASTAKQPQQPQDKVDFTEIKHLLERPQVQLEPESAKAVSEAILGERRANEKFEEMVDYYVSLAVQESSSICRTSFWGACPAMPNWSRCEPSLSICANDFGLLSQCKMHIADTALNTTSTVLGALGPLGYVGTVAENAVAGTKEVEAAKAAVTEAKEAWNTADVVKKMQMAIGAAEASRVDSSKNEMNLAAANAAANAFDKVDENTKKAIKTVLTKIDDDFSDAPVIANKLHDAVKRLALSNIASAKQAVAAAKLQAASGTLGGQAFSVALGGLGGWAGSATGAFAEGVNQYWVQSCVYEPNSETVAFLKQKNLNVDKLKVERE